MSDLIPSFNSSFTPARIPEGFTKREARALSTQQNAEIANGLVAATTLQARAMVTAVALQTTAMLSREAQFQAGGDERTAARLEHIVDGYTMFASNVVNRQW